MPYLTDKPNRKRLATESNKSDAQKAVKGAWGKVKGFAGKVADDLGEFAMRSADNAKNRPYGSSAKASAPKKELNLGNVKNFADPKAYQAKAGNSSKAEGKATIKAAPKASKPAYKAKGVPDYNKQLGDFYLNSTAGMNLTGSPKKKK